jgi:hypothetical protein
LNDKYNADIALLTDHRYEAMVALPGDWYLGNILEDDGLLQKALEKQGFSSARETGLVKMWIGRSTSA